MGDPTLEWSGNFCPLKTQKSQANAQNFLRILGITQETIKQKKTDAPQDH